jgi:hypothetical protein
MIAVRKIVVGYTHRRHCTPGSARRVA